MWFLAKPCIEESRELVTAAKILIKLRKYAHEIEETEKKENDQPKLTDEKKKTIDGCNDNIAELAKLVKRRTIKK